MAGYIQSAQLADTSGTVTSGNASFSSNVTAHSTLVCGGRIGGGVGTVSAVSDNVNGAWTKLLDQAQTNDGLSTVLWYKLNAAAGATTVTITLGAISTFRCALMEGVVDSANGDAIDVSASAEGDFTSPSAGTVTTTAAGDWIVAIVGTENDQTGTAGSGYTLHESVTSGTKKTFAESQLAGAAGNYSGDVSLGAGSDRWMAVMVAFKSAGGAADVLMPQIIF